MDTPSQSAKTEAYANTVGQDRGVCQYSRPRQMGMPIHSAKIEGYANTVGHDSGVRQYSRPSQMNTSIQSAKMRVCQYSWVHGREKFKNHFPIYCRYTTCRSLESLCIS